MNQCLFMQVLAAECGHGKAGDGGVGCTSFFLAGCLPPIYIYMPRLFPFHLPVSVSCRREIHSHQYASHFLFVILQAESEYGIMACRPVRSVDG